MFYEKDQEIERLKANLEELQLKYALDKQEIYKTLEVARTDKKKALEAVMDYEKNWKAMMSTQSYIKQVEETKSAFHELNDFISQSMQEKETQLITLQKLERMMSQGWKYVTSRQTQEVQTDFSLLSLSKPSENLKFGFPFAQDAELGRLVNTLKIVKLSDEPLDQAVKLVDIIAQKAERAKLLRMDFNDAKRLFQRVLRERTLMLQLVQPKITWNISSGSRSKQRPSISVQGVSDNAQPSVSKNSSTELPLHEFMVMMLLNLQNIPSQVALKVLRFIHSMGIQSNKIEGPKQIISHRRENSSQDILRFSPTGGARFDMQQDSPLFSVFPPHIEKIKTGHPTSLLANKILGINGEKETNLWVTNYFLVKRSELIEEFKLNALNENVIEEESKESGVNSIQHSVHLSYKDTGDSPIDQNIQVILPQGSNQTALIKLHKLIDFVKRQFYSSKDKTLAANILHALQSYNRYLPSLEVLIRPVEWPDCSMIGEFLKRLKMNGDQFSQTHSVSSTKMRKTKKHSSKRKQHRLSILQKVVEISDRKRHLLDEALILIYSLYYQIKKQEKDFAKVLLDADKQSKGFVYVTEFKKAMDELGVILTEEDLIILAQLSDFIRRIESKLDEPIDVEVECLINIDYLKLAQIIDSAKLKGSYKQYNFNYTVFEYLMLFGIERTMEEKKQKLERLWRDQVVVDLEVFSQFLLDIYKSIHATIIKRIYIEVVMAEKRQQPRTFADAFCHYLCQEGAVDSAILLNDKI